ncbi:hypothetical protein FPSE_02449 [Fusarium pseudograminearum CS3096]|uniref:Uncharacterized protein n=1 Tax=Fusarium pseudograminearum (strain CS3096) TaxID=1028729 RepID=K3UXH0_FUSPC|nr:hypothetical protein FPSE_02449 [Fusarium pseudograminearum CS3096]EKJ77371.1 hypothetical protein FPSE_02449 [Fusarium pseudograminearum CS3096]
MLWPQLSARSISLSYNCNRKPINLYPLK